MLLDRRTWGFGFLVLIVVPSFLLLSRWQFNRLDDRRDVNATFIAHANTSPAPPTDVMRPGTAFDVGQEWRQIVATGRYDSSATKLVRNQPLNGSNGFAVLTPLVLADGSELVIDRGWIGPGPDASTSPQVPDPPSGEIKVVGHARPPTSAGQQATDLPVDQISSRDPALVAAGAKTFPGYVALESPLEGQLVPWPLPSIDEGPHLSYALQWIAFAVTAVVGFVFIVRGEIRREDLHDAKTG